MNFVTYICCIRYVLKIQIVPIILTLLFSICFAGCGQQVRAPSAEQLTEFRNAGPVRPGVDWDRLVGAKMDIGPYQVVPGDVLQMTMPAILQVVTAQVPGTTEEFAPYVCRVDENGTISLPMIGEIQAAGKTLAEIEKAVIDAYYPKYAVTRPAIYAQVVEYKTDKVSITGAVQKPGVYPLRSDQMSLVALLMEAGGIVDEGAARIRIIHPYEAVATAASQKKDWERPEQAIIRLGEPAEIKGTDSRSHYLDRDETKEGEVQLVFRQADPRSTAGLLIIKHEETVLLSEQLDIASEVQRWTILAKLAERQEHVPATDVGQIWTRLSKLAQLLNGGSTERDENEVTYQFASLNAKLNSGQPLHNLPYGQAPVRKVAEKLQPVERLETANRVSSGNPEKSEPIVLPVRGLNIPFADVALRGGDTVVVEPLEMPLFTVIGLVNNPGNFPYPLEVQYNLMQALAFAGGLDKEAEPRYASIYRLKPDGEIAGVSLKFTDGSKLTDVASTLIKPGDIIDVAHTPRTRTKLFLQRIFHVHVGAYVPVFR